MDPVIKSLKHIQPRKGYVYETVLPLFAGYGDLCTPYARKESVADLESINDFENTPAFFRIMPKRYYEIWKKVGYESILYFLHTGDLGKVLQTVYREQFKDTRLGLLPC